MHLVPLLGDSVHITMPRLSHRAIASVLHVAQANNLTMPSSMAFEELSGPVIACATTVPTGATGGEKDAKLPLHESITMGCKFEF